MKWPLKKKLYVGFGVLIGLMSVLAAVDYWRLSRAQAAQQRQLEYRKVELNAEQMLTALLQARRHEKDFFARLGDETYERMLAQRVQEFHTANQAARALLGPEDEGLARLLSAVNRGGGEYQAAFDKAAALFKRRGTHATGLQKEFRDLAGVIQEKAERLGDDKLRIEVLEARRAEKDFLLRGEAKYQDLLHQSVVRARAQAEAVKGLQDIVPALLDYQKKFDEAAEASAQLTKAQAELHNTTEAVHQQLDQIQSEVGVINDRIARASAEAQQWMATIGWTVFAVALLGSLMVARLLSSQIARSIEQLIEGTRRIAQGDLTSKVDVSTNDELGELATSFNGMTDSLRTMTKNLMAASASLGEVIQELQATVSEQGAALQQQASSVSETVATVEEMSRSSGQVSETASQVLAGASRSLETSNAGKLSIQHSVQGMHDVREQVQNIARTILELSEKTQQIGAIIEAVDDFAEQSSLLALNASIEAARAGEGGKAFGVVAGEVKSLAEQSRQATEKVRTILGEIQRATHTAVMVTEEGSKRVDRGVDLVNSAGEIIRALASNISEAADSAKQIASAARQQSNGVEQINVAMAGIEQFSKQNLEAVRQTEATTQTLASVSQQLRSSSQRYVT